MKAWLLFMAAGFAGMASATAQVSGAGALEEVTLSQLSDSHLSPLGQRALAIQPAQWHHAESAHFIYHFQHRYVAAPVSSEAEVYYRFIAADLGTNTSEWERKCHIYIFETPEDWRAFQSSAQLDPWTGGVHAAGDLFIVRNPAFKFKGHSLAHELTHLVIFRFFGNGVPLWLNEGCAENVGKRAYATFFRARGYDARPSSEAMAEADFLPLAELTGAVTYPGETAKVGAFYLESERLVRFLMATGAAGKPQFRQFLTALGQGSTLDSALEKSYSTRFADLAALERSFKTYATHEYAQPAAE